MTSHEKQKTFPPELYKVSLTGAAALMTLKQRRMAPEPRAGFKLYPSRRTCIRRFQGSAGMDKSCESRRI